MADINGWTIFNIYSAYLAPFVVTVFVPARVDPVRLGNEVVFLSNAVSGNLTRQEQIFQIQERLQTFVLVVYS